MMRRVAAVLLGFLLLGATCELAQAQSGGVQCNRKATYDASTNGSTVLVAGQSNQSMELCGFVLFSGGTVNVKLVYGTGTACDTGTTDITPAFQFVAQTGVVDPSQGSRGLFVPRGNDLCINASAGVAAQAIVYYARRSTVRWVAAALTLAAVLTGIAHAQLSTTGAGGKGGSGIPAVACPADGLDFQDGCGTTQFMLGL